MDDALVAARAVVDEIIPAAHWAVLAGGILTEACTAGSDLDIVACLPDDPGLLYRRSLRRHGWPVELFFHDRPSLALPGKGLGRPPAGAVPHARHRPCRGWRRRGSGPDA